LHYVRVSTTGFDPDTPGSLYNLDVVLDGPDECHQDPSEPNDSFATASTVVEADYIHTVVCEGDVDYYALDVLAGDTLTIQALFDPTEGDVQLELFDEGELSRGSSLGTTGTETVVWTTPIDQTVYIHTWLNGPDTGVAGVRTDLIVEIAAADDCVDDRSGNDTFDSAATVIEADYNNIALCGDDDYYRVFVREGETITFTTTLLPTDGDLDLTMFTQAGVVLDTATGDSATHALTHTATWSEFVYLRASLVEDRGMGGVGYDFHVDIDGPAVCVEESAEVNDSIAQADLIPEGLHRNLGACEGDVDFWAVDLRPGDTLTATADFSHADGDIDMALVNAAGTTLDSSASNTDDEVVTYVAPGTERVYVRVALDGPDTGGPAQSYDLDLDIVGPDHCPDDDFEPNDSAAAATLLDEDTVHNLVKCPSNDDDWFRIPVLAGDELTVTADFAHNEGNLQLALYSDAGSTLVDASTSGTDDEVVQHTSSTSRTMYVRVYRSGGDTGNVGQPYVLDLDIEGATTSHGGAATPASCVEDDLEPNQNTSQAPVLNEGRYDDLAYCNGNVEYYRFTLGPFERVDASLLFTDADMDLNIDIRNSAFSLLVRASSTSNNETVSYTNGGSTATFYFYVWQSGGDPGPNVGVNYALDWSITGTPLCLDDSFEPNDSTSQAPVIVQGDYQHMTNCNDSD
jgi:hypothetical protein